MNGDYHILLLTVDKERPLVLRLVNITLQVNIPTIYQYVHQEDIGRMVSPILDSIHNTVSHLSAIPTNEVLV